jgi:hypothetical protein
MRNSIARTLVLLASAVIGTSVAQAASNAVIIQAWLPHEGAGLDWVTGNPDTVDELWNDC